MSTEGRDTTPLSYRSAGVDIEAADDAKTRIGKLVESTRTAGCIGAFGSFGGMFRAPTAGSPILVASADGVGTKIKVAIEAGRHDTVGHCLVNHCVNDILAQGATPLFFLDYVAFGALEPAVVEAVVAGVAAGCRENQCALIGGETAEMPGLYTPPDYDLAGFIVGTVQEGATLGADRVRAGDVLIGFESSGLHTNGYSLARRIVTDRLRLTATDPFPGESGASVADVLLRVHRSYLAAVRPVLGRVRALAHITGGGLPGNLNRAPAAVARRDRGHHVVGHPQRLPGIGKRRGRGARRDVPRLQHGGGTRRRCRPRRRLVGPAVGGRRRRSCLAARGGRAGDRSGATRGGAVGSRRRATRWRRT
ncbi:MAG: phosphoribosylformylglycinamidine cyclo-ligase [Gemmatimonadetes bacterium]|nr:phosphoribosylformylglycinamidine cyclo-ligase [Gemmatimonadota bacterium]